MTLHPQETLLIQLDYSLLIRQPLISSLKSPLPRHKEPTNLRLNTVLSHLGGFPYLLVLPSLDLSPGSLQMRGPGYSQPTDGENQEQSFTLISKFTEALQRGYITRCLLTPLFLPIFLRVMVWPVCDFTSPPNGSFSLHHLHGTLQPLSASKLNHNGELGASPHVSVECVTAFFLARCVQVRCRECCDSFQLQRLCIILQGRFVSDSLSEVAGAL